MRRIAELRRTSRTTSTAAIEAPLAIERSFHEVPGTQPQPPRLLRWLQDSVFAAHVSRTSQHRAPAEVASII